MYEFICTRCGRRYYSASSTGAQNRCAVCGGELEPTGVKGELSARPSFRLLPVTGYGSSLFEETERCTPCGGSGLVMVAEPAQEGPNGHDPVRPGQQD